MKKIILDIMIDVKYLKGKRGKKEEKISVLLFSELNGHQERSVQFTEGDLPLNHPTE